MMNTVKKFVYILLGCMCFGALLSGCGVKPGSVEPPPGETSDFPRTYPSR